MDPLKNDYVAALSLAVQALNAAGAAIGCVAANDLAGSIAYYQGLATKVRALRDELQAQLDAATLPGNNRL